MTEARDGGPVRLAMVSDVGRVRARNEDAIDGCAESGWALVADGMGGHRGGDVASAIVVREVRAEVSAALAGGGAGVDRAGLVSQAIRRANRAIFSESNRDLKLYGMGSTAVLACFAGSTLIVGHVGDSRAYLFRNRVLKRLTVDHSLLQELLDGGMISPAEASRAPGRGVLTRSLGVDPDVAVEVASLPLQPGDLVLLCSDGLTEMLSDEELSKELGDGDGDLEGLAARLVDRANRSGGRDNVSVVLAAP